VRTSARRAPALEAPYRGDFERRSLPDGGVPCTKVQPVTLRAVPVESMFINKKRDGVDIPVTTR
jgi:hypothetical protein